MLNDSEKTKAQLIEELVSLRFRAAHPELKRDLQHSYLPVKSDDGTVVGISCVVQDLTDSKRAHESLRLTQFALDHAADPVYWVRHDGRIFYANHAACESLGYSRDELLSMSVSEIDPDFPAEAWPAHWQALKQSGRSTFEAHHQTKRGRVFPVEITTNYLTDGPHEFIWAFVHDITERKRAENVLRQREMELAHVARLSMLGEMVAGVVHEVGQPLYSIGNFSKACENHIEQNEPVETEKLSHWLAEISACVRRSKEILSRLKGFARKGAPQPKALSIDRAIGESIKMFEFELRRHNVAVDYDRVEGIVVLADDVQVQQVLTNLIRNACESFNASGSEDARLTIRTKSRDGFCDVSVEDNGPGMNEEQIERAFQSFFTSKASGLGLGLAISKTIVEGHGGKIAIVPNRHRGITCHFTLPLARGDE